MKPIDIVEFLIQYSFFLIAAAVHESSHAWSAFRFGDPTAKLQNRISLNPLNHIDPIGTVLIPFFVFLSNIPVIGWAKPTPVNTENFKNPRRDGMYVSGAGPVSNLLCVAALAIFWHVAFFMLRYFTVENVQSWQRISLLFCYVFATGILVNLMLAVFNMLPIHPLDGSGVLEGILPHEWANAYEKMRPFGFIILLILFYLPAFKRFIGTIVFGSGRLLGIHFFDLEQIWR